MDMGCFIKVTHVIIPFCSILKYFPIKLEL
jgi:hypothetical protein